MDNFDYQEDIEIMCTVNQHLEIIESPHTDYILIAGLVKKYLQTHCRHVIVEDVIDISPETSKTIHYCSKCMHTFS